jgi:hypothetical protein
MLIVASESQERERFNHAAREAAAAGLRVEVEHPVRWPWACKTAVRATISENGGCACSLLSDAADWDADFWATRPEILDQLARTLQIIVDEGPPRLTAEALWIGETPRQTSRVTAAELIELARSSRLGTKTRYELSTDGTNEEAVNPDGTRLR